MAQSKNNWDGEPEHLIELCEKMLGLINGPNGAVAVLGAFGEIHDNKEMRDLKRNLRDAADTIEDFIVNYMRVD